MQKGKKTEFSFVIWYNNDISSSFRNIKNNGILYMLGYKYDGALGDD